MKFRLVDIGPKHFGGIVTAASLDELLVLVRKHLVTQEAELDVMTCEMKVQDFKICGRVEPLDQAACDWVNAERARISGAIIAAHVARP